MNSFWKVMAMGSAAVLMAASLAACGGDAGSSSKGEDKTSLAASGAADLGLVKAGTLIMGTNAEFPPFEYEENGAIIGVDAELMDAIAKKLNLKLEITNTAFDSLPEYLSTKKIDVIAAGFTQDADRATKMDFTDYYYTALQTIIVKSDSAVTKKAELKGKKIGGQTGTTGLMNAEDLTSKDKIKGYANGSLAVEDLLNGNLDAVIIDNNPAKEYKTNHGDKIKLLENQFDEEYYVMGVSKGNKALKEAINGALKELKSDGTYQGIIDKYIK